MCPKAIDAGAIEVVMDLHRAAHSNKEIAKLKGMELRTAQGIIQRYRQGGGVELPVAKKAPGRQGCQGWHFFFCQLLVTNLALFVKNL